LFRHVPLRGPAGQRRPIVAAAARQFCELRSGWLPLVSACSAQVPLKQGHDGDLQPNQVVDPDVPSVQIHGDGQPIVQSVPKFYQSLHATYGERVALVLLSRERHSASATIPVQYDRSIGGNPTCGEAIFPLGVAA
jgi:hypothetical protein